MSNEEMQALLTEANLTQYLDSFIQIGGDDVAQLVGLLHKPDELQEILQMVGMADKPLHVKRLKQALENRQSASRPASTSSAFSCTSFENKDPDQPLFPVAPPVSAPNAAYPNLIPPQMHLPLFNQPLNPHLMALALRYFNPAQMQQHRPIIKTTT
ncbi:NGFI-A binding protein 1 (EGR1 binding protein 1), partial [Cichlidogyrus casuarinus]